MPAESVKEEPPKREMDIECGMKKQEERGLASEQTVKWKDTNSVWVNFLGICHRTILTQTRLSLEDLVLDLCEQIR